MTVGFVGSATGSAGAGFQPAGKSGTFAPYQVVRGFAAALHSACGAKWG
jgi:hypothetical protein